jgi:hypothetical protein
VSTELTDLKTVLNELLSTDPSVRKRADVQLQSQLSRFHDENRRSEPWPTEIQDLLAALQPDPATFLATLLADWAWACALQLQLRVGADQLATAEIVRWQPRDTALATPMHFSRMSMYGFGVSQLFERIGSTGLPLRRAFCELLAHPEPIVPCVALDAIASMGAAAQDCFPAALEHLATSQFDSAKRTAVLNFARSVSDAVAVIRARLNANHGDAEIAALTYLLEQLGAGDPEVAGVLLRQIQRATTDEGRASCAHAAIRTVAALDVEARALSARELIPLFRVWSSDASERLRAAAAFGLAAFGTAADADLLLRLARDAHPWVITELAWGVELSGNATTDIVTEFGKRLGDYSGFDGEPHDAMISALTRLAPNTDISAIQADLVRWVDALATESYDYHAYTATFELIERLPGSLQRALFAFAPSRGTVLDRRW